MAPPAPQRTEGAARKPKAAATAPAEEAPLPQDGQAAAYSAKMDPLASSALASRAARPTVLALAFSRRVARHVGGNARLVFLAEQKRLEEGAASDGGLSGGMGGIGGARASGAALAGASGGAAEGVSRGSAVPLPVLAAGVPGAASASGQKPRAFLPAPDALRVQRRRVLAEQALAQALQPDAPQARRNPAMLPLGRAAGQGAQAEQGGVSDASGDAVQKALAALSQAIDQIRKATDLSAKASEGTATKPISQITAEDLVPVQRQAVAKEKVETEGHNEEEELRALDLSGKTLQQRVAELRKRPELLKRFMEEAESSKRAQREAQKKAAWQARVRNREGLLRTMEEIGDASRGVPGAGTIRSPARAPLRPTTGSRQASQQASRQASRPGSGLPPPLATPEPQYLSFLRASKAAQRLPERSLQAELPPLVQDAGKQHRRQLRAGLYAPDAKAQALRESLQRDEQKRSLALREAEEMDEERAARAREELAYRDARLAGGPILPQNFVLQRKRLCALLFFTARFSLLRDVAITHQDVESSNHTIESAAVLIQLTARCHQASRNFANSRAAAATIQRASRLFLVRRRVALRKRASGAVKQFLATLYAMGSWVCPVLRDKEAVGKVVRGLAEYRTRKLAKLEAIKRVLQTQDAVSVRAALLQHKQRLAEIAAKAEAKKRSFGGPAKKKGQEAAPIQVSDQEVAEKLLPLDFVNVVARCLFRHMTEVNSAAIDEVYSFNSSRYEGQPPAVFLFLPSEECATEVLAAVRAVCKPISVIGKAAAAEAAAMPDPTVEDVQSAANSYCLENPSRLAVVRVSAASDSEAADGAEGAVEL